MACAARLSMIYKARVSALVLLCLLISCQEPVGHPLEKRLTAFQSASQEATMQTESIGERLPMSAVCGEAMLVRGVGEQQQSMRIEMTLMNESSSPVAEFIGTAAFLDPSSGHAIVVHHRYNLSVRAEGTIQYVLNVPVGGRSVQPPAQLDVSCDGIMFSWKPRMIRFVNGVTEVVPCSTSEHEEGSCDDGLIGRLRSGAAIHEEL